MQDSPPGVPQVDQQVDAGRYGRLLAPALARPYAMIEVVLGMAFVLVCCRLVRPDDPLLLQMDFPWIWLAPLVFALRYGALLGVLAGLCVPLAWFVFYGHAPNASPPLMLFIGGVTVLVVAGHFCDIWKARSTRQRAVIAYLENRLASISTNHYLLRVSHERLERDILAKPFTLRSALEHLRGLVGTAEPQTGLANVSAMLQFIATGCQIGEASIFAATAGEIDRRPAASVGEPFELDVDDALLGECLEKRSLSHLRQGSDSQSSYLVCAPILASSGRLAGVLVVRQMAFLALNFENLQLLLVLLSYYADGIEQRALVAPVQDCFPQCPHEFALELARLGHMTRTIGLGSSLVCLVFPRSELAGLIQARLLRERRGLELLWTYDLDCARVLVVLLPLAGDEGVDEYLLGVEHNIKTRFDTSLAAAQVSIYRGSVQANEPCYGLSPLLSRCKRHG